MGKGSGKKKEAALVPEIVAPVLSRRHEAAITALLSHPTIKDAAKAAGVSESTLWRLMQREDFQRRYREAQETALDGALGTLQGAASQAIGTLVRNLSCGTAAAEVGAAKALLDFTLKARELFGLGRRLEELEAFILRRQEQEALDRARRKGADEDEDDE